MIKHNSINNVCLIFFLAGLFLHQLCLASAGDSLTVEHLKYFILREFNYKTPDQFFTVWNESNKPTVTVYVSSASSVGKLGDRSSMIIIHGPNEELANKTSRRYDSLGFHTLIYRTYGTTSAELSSRFMSYSSEAKAFIILHEFVHYYLRDLKIQIPFEYHEALCDLVGLYSTVEFALHSASEVDIKSARSQLTMVEAIYRHLNRAISKIDKDSTSARKINAWTQWKVDHILTDDLFQNDRFRYVINNAYLFRYRAYAGKYFLLLQLLRRQGSVSKLLHVLENAPRNTEGFEQYLRGLPEK